MDFLQNSIKTLKKYMNEITNYFLERNSSGFVEGFNNKIKVLTRRSKKCRKVFKLLKLDTEGLGMFRFSGVCENTYSMEIHRAIALKLPDEFKHKLLIPSSFHSFSFNTHLRLIFFKYIKGGMPYNT